MRFIRKQRHLGKDKNFQNPKRRDNQCPRPKTNTSDEAQVDGNSRAREALKLKTKPATEKSEKEIRFFLEQQFGAEDIETGPKVGDKKADFRIKSIDTYVEVHALKDIASDQMDFLPRIKNVVSVELKEDGQKKILDRIAKKLLHECAQLPKGKKNLIVAKTEGFFTSPNDVIDAIIGDSRLVVNKENMQTSIGHGPTAFRTEEELQEVLQKISAVIAYNAICRHVSLCGISRARNKNNAEVPFDGKTLTIFQNFLCHECQV